MELRHLRYFVAVAEMENVTRAATEKLHVAQPSWSRQIRDLEDEVGVPLLERTAKSVRLTDAGRAFLDDARAILKQTDDAVLRARAIGGSAPNCTSGIGARDRAGYAFALRLPTDDAKREGEAARLAS